ncbi:hypothetical protein MG293_014293 [Ovis ammon polii]|uniref:Uncharacterized protein n=1 Tax=Ovis ammon polii TaxID=230172 RepID=A0AAD4U009_OVIAM|nr:hypothetical protein MG293_014293 [Ovis ammon polii]
MSVAPIRRDSETRTPLDLWRPRPVTLSEPGHALVAGPRSLEGQQRGACREKSSGDPRMPYPGPREAEPGRRLPSPPVPRGQVPPTGDAAGKQEVVRRGQRGHVAAAQQHLGAGPKHKATVGKMGQKNACKPPSNRDGKGAALAAVDDKPPTGGWASPQRPPASSVNKCPAGTSHSAPAQQAAAHSVCENLVFSPPEAPQVNECRISNATINYAADNNGFGRKLGQACHECFSHVVETPASPSASAIITRTSSPHEEAWEVDPASGWKDGFSEVRNLPEQKAELFSHRLENDEKNMETPIEGSLNSTTSEQ